MAQAIATINFDAPDADTARAIVESWTLTAGLQVQLTIETHWLEDRFAQTAVVGTPFTAGSDGNPVGSEILTPLPSEGGSDGAEEVG